MNPVDYEYVDIEETCDTLDDMGYDMFVDHNGKVCLVPKCQAVS